MLEAVNIDEKSEVVVKANEKKWGKAGYNTRLLHVLHVGFKCAVVFSILYPNPDSDILATFPAGWVVSFRRTNTLA